MDRSRNPSQRGESFTSFGRGGEIFGDDDSVEGHSMTIDRPEDQEGIGSSGEDTEGHLGARRGATDDEDVEGHAMNRKASDDEDVEGHAYNKR